MTLQRAVLAIIYPDDEEGYVAECPQLHAVTEGGTLDEVVANLREAVAVAIHGLDLGELGFAERPIIQISFQVEPAVA
jgi:predicted RNase H-like HicB family nuclease